MSGLHGWVGWAGTHPLAVWLCGLVLATGAAGVLHAAVLRGAGPRPAWPAHLPRPSGPAGLAAAMVLAAALVWACAHTLALIADAWGQPTTAWAVLDDGLAGTLRATASVGTLTLFAWLTHFGDTAVLFVLASGVGLALLWRGHRMLATGWAVALAGNGLLTRAFKHSFERIRPVHTHEIAVADGFSFPSGHSSSSLVAYTMLAYLAIRLLPPRWHLPAMLAAAAVIVTVGWSRVVLQVHFASDVLGGWITGGVWVTCCLLLLQGATRWHRLRSAAATPTTDGALR